MTLTTTDHGDTRNPVPLVLPPEPKTVAEAVNSMHAAAASMENTLRRLERLIALEGEPPEMRTVVINEGNTGVYQVIDKAAWPAKSIGILNPGSAAVYIGIGGNSARTTSRAPTCPGASAMVLPVGAQDLELGCDPAVLGANTAVVYVFRYVTVQRLSLG